MTQKPGTFMDHIDAMTPELLDEIAEAADFLLPIAQASKGWPVEVQAWLVAVRETSRKNSSQLSGVFQ